MRRRGVILAGAGVIGLVLGLWILDWWTLRIHGSSLRANLRHIEACDAQKCVGGPTGGILAGATLWGGSLLALVTAVVGVLHGVGVQLGKHLVRGQIGLALLGLGGAAVMIAIAPPGLAGAGFSVGGWVTIVSTIVCAAAGVAIVSGDDPMGEGRLYQPIKVDVSAATVESNAMFAGATIPPFAMARRGGSSGSSLYGKDTVPPAAPPPAGTTVPPWQPAIREAVHVEAPSPRRRSTRLPFTQPPSFDTARQALRFVVAEATIGDDGLTVTLEDHRKLQLAWKVFTLAAARQLPPGPPFDRVIVVDVCTIGGAPLRFLPSSRVNYAALPGGAAPNSRENLRRLVAHVKTVQPTFGVEHDSSEFFAGGREPPGFLTLRQFVAYDEQYTGVIGTPPPVG